MDQNHGQSSHWWIINQLRSLFHLTSGKSDFKTHPTSISSESWPYYSWMSLVVSVTTMHCTLERKRQHKPTKRLYQSAPPGTFWSTHTSTCSSTFYKSVHWPLCVMLYVVVNCIQSLFQNISKGCTMNFCRYYEYAIRIKIFSQSTWFNSCYMYYTF